MAGINNFTTGLNNFVRSSGQKCTDVIYELCKNNQGKTGFHVIMATLLIGILLCAFSTDILAMPPYSGLSGNQKASPYTKPYFIEFIEQIRAKGVNAPGDLLTKHKSGLRKVSISGSINILTILVDFSDKISSVPAISFDTLIYVDQSGTVMNYYKEVSYNTLTITTVSLPSSVGWLRAPQTYAYYCDNQNGLGAYPQNAQKLVEDAVDAIDPFVDFSLYDNDSDSYVDGLIVVHTGPGAEMTLQNSDIWSHKWGITPRLKDGVYISTYSMEPEYWNSPGDMTCGVYCHELGHVFGLPDLYDIDNPSDSEGIGNWSIMAGGSWNGTLGSSPAHFDAWSKIQLGFITPTVLNTDQAGVSLPAVKINPTIYKIWTNGNPVSEYYLVENRQQIAYDTYLPSNGLLIWYVDDTQSDNTNQWWPGCGWSSHYKVALVQADNQWDMEHDINRGDNGDPYPGSANNRTFDGTSSPNSNDYNGSATNISITSISDSDTNMSADICVGIPQFVDDDNFVIPDRAKLYQNYPNPFNSKTNINFLLKQRASVSIEIYDISGKLIRTIFSGELNAGNHELFWDGSNSSGQIVSSGVYFYSFELDDNALCRKMLLIK